MPGTGYFELQRLDVRHFGVGINGKYVHQAHPKCGMIEIHLKYFRLEPLNDPQKAPRTEEGALAMATKALG